MPGLNQEILINPELCHAWVPGILFISVQVKWFTLETSNYDLVASVTVCYLVTKCL